MPTRKRFEADPAALGDIREFVAEASLRHSFRDYLSDILLAVNEACANAILHTDSPSVEIRIRWDPNRLEVEIADQGVFGQAERPGLGFGFRLMRSAMDEFSIQKGTLESPGTVVRLAKQKVS